ncbi:MAG: hypothetical protein V9H26_13785 [Verrucomicrobiota bacterium]|nr:hypothetical protein [Verrucomicrobiota bacterium]MCC6819303.1 hypothetical protein [Limisphaerales bacterium]
MILAAQLSHGHSDPELFVGFLGGVILIGFGVWALIKRMLKETAQPDPWDQNIAAEMGEADATPLCHRCLTAHDASTDFCAVCGAAVGQYTNWLPYPQLLSVGHALRIGTSGEFRRSPLAVFFFFLVSLVEYTLFAPVYWIVMFRRLNEPHVPDNLPQPAPPNPGATNP